MLHEIGRDLEALLAAKGCPFKVLDREAFKPTAWRNVIVIEHDTDAFGPTRQMSENPKRYYTRKIGARLTIYAKSASGGALEFEHRRLAERVLDLALVALRKVGATRKNGLDISGGKFVQIPDLAPSEAQGGAAYELAFTFERGVADRTWAGAIAAEATLASGSIASTTKISRHRGPDDDDDPNTVPAAAETACGA